MFNDFLNIASVTVPVLGVVLVGLLAAKARYFPAEDIPVLARFATRVALPAALFSVIAVQDIGTLFEPTFHGPFVTGTLLACGLVFIWLRLQGAGAPLDGLAMLGVGTCNCMMIGLPIAMALVGPMGIAAMGMVPFFQDLVIVPLAMVLANRARGDAWQDTLWASLLHTLKSPFILAVVAGLCVAALPIEPPQVALDSLKILAGALSSIGLFLVGGLLASARITGLFQVAVPVVVGKLLLHPLAVVGAFAVIAPQAEADVRVSAIFAACLPMIGAYPAFSAPFGDKAAQQAALATLLGTLLSFGTLTVALTILL